MGPRRFRGRFATDWLQHRRSRSYASSMSATAISDERGVPLPVRVELRSLDDDLTEGRITPAEYGALVGEVLVALGVPVAEAED